MEEEISASDAQLLSFPAVKREQSGQASGKRSSGRRKKRCKNSRASSTSITTTSGFRTTRPTTRGSSREAVGSNQHRCSRRVEQDPGQRGKGGGRRYRHRRGSPRSRKQDSRAEGPGQQRQRGRRRRRRPRHARGRDGRRGDEQRQGGRRRVPGLQAPGGQERRFGSLLRLRHSPGHLLERQQPRQGHKPLARGPRRTTGYSNTPSTTPGSMGSWSWPRPATRTRARPATPRLTGM